MQARNKTIKNLLTKSLAIAMTAVLAFPVGVMAEEPPTEISEKPVITCSSEGKKSYTASLKVEVDDVMNYMESLDLDVQSETETKLVMPKEADAHFVYYDDGVRYEGKNLESMKIYEGCTVYVYVRNVQGYDSMIEFPDISYKDYADLDSSLRLFDTYGSSYYSIVKVEKDYTVYRFTMPACDIPSKAGEIPVTVRYLQMPDDETYSVYFYDEDLVSDKELAKTVTGSDDGKVAYNTLITLPDAPETFEDDEDFYWVQTPCPFAFVYSPTMGKFYKPGDQVRITGSGANSFFAIELPVIQKPNYIKLSTYEVGNMTMLKFSVDTAALKDGEAVESLIIQGLGGSGGKESINAIGTSVDLTDECVMTVDGLIMPLNYVFGYTGIKIKATKVTGVTKETVIDVRSGSCDLSALDKGKKINYYGMGSIGCGLVSCGRYDYKTLFADRLGSATPHLYFNALDLNEDGNYDLRFEDPYSYYGDDYGKYSLSDDVPLKEKKITEVEEYNPFAKLIRMKGAEPCESSYSFDSGFAEYGKVIIKLFDAYKVTFTDDGKTLSEQEVKPGKTAKEPAVPTKEGFTFKGWQLASGGTGLYDFKTPVNADVTLKAVWEKIGKNDPAGTVVGKDVGTKLTVGKIVYVVTKQGDANNMPEVSYSADKKNQGKKKTVKVPDTITVDGVTYKVTALEKNALANEKKAKTIILGKYIKAVPAKAVKGCKKLKTLKVTNMDEVVKLNKKSLTGTKGKIKLLVPKAFYNDYKKQIKKLKLTKKVTLKKF